MNGKVTISVEVDWFYATTIAGIVAALNASDSPEELALDMREALLAGLDELIDTAADIFNEDGHVRLVALLKRQLETLGE